jgi:hypothetical protein
MTDIATLKVRLVDASLKGYTFRASNLSGVITIYMVNGRSFWTVARLGTRHLADSYVLGEYVSGPIRLKDVLDLIDKRWDFTEIYEQTMRELDYWIPSRRNA